MADNDVNNHLGPNVATNLYPHQKKALTFLLEREKEKTSGPNQLWKVRKDGFGKPIAWKNAVTDKEIHREPIECKGAILADDVSQAIQFCVIAWAHGDGVFTLSSLIFRLDGSRQDNFRRLSHGQYNGLG